ncbi:hypothetical protein PRUPE_5G066000 [Prunus persica]|uniref:Gfo/Idh/MocA-like oxidoreductase N-terminal domain-containing protein n=1 Tax=Prunus persica TaxID=3760 RepID=A0A251P4K5_PRUPE|nr:uncharacterized protein LOC18776864 isoform X2 [Prunus persica]XP_034217142.1 inositol 2-dehydrogenase/D-chiro-inositol 3-dehydrogenase isoform X2 [Prunus dulcis]ONI06519.1 hypothetical protein PRUPE_5G066000 [Prunus persica]
MAASNIVKYGIVGVGMMGREHLINLHHLRTEGVAVVAIADPHVPSQKLALDLAQSFNWPIKVFSAHKELLDSLLCDVVVVSSPNMTHYQILMDIINHPKPHHVLVEKPLCTTVAHCKEVVNAARKRQDILVQVGLEYRYMPPVAKLIEIVKGGSLGQVKMVAIREHRFPFLVKVNNWNRFNINSGGTLVEKCCHFFDLMRLFAGANPVRVMASGAIDVNHKDEIYDGKGEAFVPESIVRHGTRVEGRDGVQTLKAENDQIKYDGLHHGSSYLEHLHFLSAIRAKAKAPAVDLHDGLVSVAIGVAAQLSIEKGRFVTIEEVMS